MQQSFVWDTETLKYEAVGLCKCWIEYKQLIIRKDNCDPYNVTEIDLMLATNAIVDAESSTNSTL